ncbi:MAG: hypothetical protein ACQESY_12100 [Pseudomonadota bacterium]
MQAELSQGEDPDTGLRHWQWQEAGIHFKLTQRLPDQTRAFFDARGFDKPARERIALACVFQSEFKNTAGDDQPPVEYELTDWRIHTDEGSRSLMVRETWAPIWQQHELPEPAQIAFEWALLPTYQKYAAGDYNWGMTVYGLAPGSTFDLEFSWSRGDKQYTRRIDGIECPPDIHP